MDFILGSRVRIKDDEMGRTWGVAGELGTVTGPDPQGANGEVLAVTLDNGFALFAVKGVHVAHLEAVR
jgi:hypothetical protein